MGKNAVKTAELFPPHAEAVQKQAGIAFIQVQGLNACVANRIQCGIEFIDGARRICFKVKASLLNQ